MPFLKEAARNRGLDIVFSEMRFGIRDTASSANLTSEGCMRELKRCLGESSGISYLLIAGHYLVDFALLQGPSSKTNSRICAAVCQKPLRCS
jgi:hypothetical protein